MKYKKDLGALLVFLGIVWNVFSSIRSSYTPTQVILVAIPYTGILACTKSIIVPVAPLFEPVSV